MIAASLAVLRYLAPPVDVTLPDFQIRSVNTCAALCALLAIYLWTQNISCELLLGTSLEVAASLLFQDCTAFRRARLGQVERQRYEVSSALLMRVRILWDVKLCGWLMVVPV